MPNQWTWESLQAVVTITGRVKTYTAEEIHWAARECGLPSFPPSYVELMTRFGLGEWELDFFISVPRHESSSATIANSIALGRGTAATLIKGGVKIPQLDVFRRLLIIGGDGCGFSIGWDPAERRGDGEMPLYMTDRDDLAVIPVGADSLDFLGNYWVNGKLGKVYPRSGEGWITHPCPLIQVAHESC